MQLSFALALELLKHICPQAMVYYEEQNVSLCLLLVNLAGVKTFFS